MDKTACYQDIQGQRTRATGFSVDPASIAAGWRFALYFPGCEVTALERILTQDYDFYRNFHRELPQFSCYPVPALTVFAIDSHGGSFVTPSDCFSLADEAAPMYYLSRERALYYLAPNPRGLLSLLVFCPDWKAQLGLSISMPLVCDRSRNYVCEQLALQACSLPTDKAPLSVRFFSSEGAAREVLHFVDSPQDRKDSSKQR